MDHAGRGESTTAAILAAQHGVISRAQALDAGITARTIEWRVRRGEWRAVHRGVYRLAAVPVTWHQRAMAACLAAGPRAVASHRAAAALWGLDGIGQGRPEVTTTTSGGRELRGVIVHHSRSLARGERAARDGIPCTSATRTLIDLAAVLDKPALETALDSTLREGLTSVRYLPRRLGPQGRKGTGLLRELVADREEERPHESPKEAELARLLAAAGLPAPVRQYELRDKGRLVARFDLAWPEARVAVEFQSYRHHFGRHAWRRDAARANRAAAAGWLLFMATDEDVQDGCGRLAADLRSACAA